MKQLARMEKSKPVWFLIITSFLFFLFRFPSLFEPYWYGDEGIYHVIGMAMQKGRILYAEIWDNKPPLLYLLYSFFGGDQFGIRLVSLIFGVGSVVVFFNLARKFFSLKTAYVTTGAFALLFGTPILEGNIANAENFMLLPILGSALLIILSQDSDRKKAQFLEFASGFLLSLAFLFKIVAIFDFAAFFLFLLFLSLKKRSHFEKVAKSIIPYLLGFLLPLLLIMLFLVAKGNFLEFLNSVFFQMIGYVGYGNTLFFPQGFLIIKLGLLTLATVYLFRTRSEYKESTLFILLWLMFSIFNALFAQRPYTHYLLVLLPSLVLVGGLLYTDKQYKKALAIILIITLFVILKNFSFYGKTVYYYQNFLSYLMGQKNLYSYINFFDRRTSKNYALAQYIKPRVKTNDVVFLWGNSAQFYKMIGKLPPGRYAVAYHITANKKSVAETGIALARTKPKYIILEEGKENFPYSLVGYTRKININDAIIYERAF